MSVKNSSFLQFLLDKAEEIRVSAGKEVLTENHFFAAVLQYCSKSALTEVTDTRFDVKEVEAVYNLVKNAVNLEDSDDYVNALTKAPVSHFDDLNLFMLINISSKVAERQQEKEISADTILAGIINAPTDEIKNILKDSKAESNDTAISDESIKKAQASLSGLFGKPVEKVEDKKVEEVKDATEDKAETLIFDSSKQKKLIEELTEKSKDLQKKLSSAVLGQENAIDIFTSGYFQGELRSITDKKARKPKATYLFAGPPGVGKTFLAEQIAELLKLPFKRFDMSEYATPSAVMDLCGFKGTGEGVLTGFVAKNPKCVLLFDEIEKSYIDAIHLFLQVLDAGRLGDGYYGKEVSFKDTIIIFTTNAGRMLYESSQTFNLAHISRKTILKALENDVDPRTGRGAFPAAICSRFATGNVVLFNHMEAHILRSIVEKELLRSVSEFQEETEIKCNIADEVPSCILFAEGGHADARTITSRAGTFFSNELYELLRLVSADDNNYEIKNIENINVDVSLDNCEENAVKLFKDTSVPSILVFASEKISSAVREALKDINVTVVSSYNEAVELTNKNSYSLLLCDLYAGIEDDANHLNIEDVYSEGTNFFEYACENLDNPLYVVCDEQNTYTDEELFSLIKQGARQLVDVSDIGAFTKKIDEILTQIRHQESMTSLARSNKIVSYKTSQTISEDGKTACIYLYDIELETAVDAEDTKTIMNNMSRPNVRFDDVIGADDAKVELQFFVDYLKNPKEYASKGLGIPKGVLFYGPPGTGKTLLAKAVAGESDLTFISVAGNQFLDKYVGEGERRMRELFATARKYAPTIVFIDEVDAIAKERKGEHAAPDSILTALLAEMDGFKVDAKKPVFVLAATNFELDGNHGRVLDGAFVRRFDRQIYVDLPNKVARIKFMKMKISKNPIFRLTDDEIENLAIRSTGMSLANLASVFEFSMRIAFRQNKDCVDGAVFEEAFETFNFGEEKKWDSAELRKTAYHEAGHAFLCWYSGEKPSYLTIVARGNHGGYMLHGDNENIGSYTKKMLLDRIRTALGGRASELVFFGEEDGLTTGASGDLNTATAIAKNMICKYGMDKSIGLAVVDDAESRDGALAVRIRDAVNNVLNDELENAKEILKTNKNAVDAIVEVLLQKNHLTAEEIDKIFAENTK